MCERSIGVCLRALSWTEESWHNSIKNTGVHTHENTYTDSLSVRHGQGKIAARKQRASHARRGDFCPAPRLAHSHCVRSTPPPRVPAEEGAHADKADGEDEQDRERVAEVAALKGAAVLRAQCEGSVHDCAGAKAWLLRGRTDVRVRSLRFRAAMGTSMMVRRPHASGWPTREIVHEMIARSSSSAADSWTPPTHTQWTPPH